MFYLLVVVIVVFSIFPFYYAIVTSFATGTDLFAVRYWPASFDLSNYKSVLGGRTFPRNILNSVFIAPATASFALFLAVTASYALARVPSPCSPGRRRRKFRGVRSWQQASS